MSLLGIDVGTSGCKAAAFTVDGKCLYRAYRGYPTLNPRDGWQELDATLVWTQVQEVITEVAHATHRDPITALSVSSMGEAMVPVARDRRILGMSILGADNRGQEAIDDLLCHLDQEAFYNINPNILSRNYALPKLRWIKDHAPDQFAATGLFLLWADAVGFLLGGEAASSYSLANRTLLFDIHLQDWSDTLLSHAGLDRSKLAPCLPAGAPAGVVSDAMADRLGLPRGVAIVVGGHDQCTNALGAGITTPGQAVDGIGTVECITPVFAGVPELRPMLVAGLNVEHHVVPGLFAAFIFNQAGALTRWFCDTFAAGQNMSDDIYRQLEDDMPLEPTSLFVLPYFQPSGSPHYINDAAGVILGLKTSTTRGQIYRAFLESITYYFAEPLLGLEKMGRGVHELIATGGGAVSDRWLQMKADILGIPYKRLKNIDGSVVGAAILAGVGSGALTTFAAAVPAFVTHERTFEPNPARHKAYQARLAHYRTLLPLLHPTLKAGAAFGSP